MKKQQKFSFRNIPGWAFVLALFGILYLTGLHVEAIGQVQRLLAGPDIRQADAAPAPVSEAGGPEDSPSVGDGFMMTDLNGRTVDFGSLKGKVVFVNIWATWCPPCVAEMPNIQKLYEKTDGKDIAFVMLSVDQEGLAKVKKYIDRKGYTFPVYLPASPLPQELQSSAIPTTFIISPEGKIVARQEGMAEYDTPEVREFLQSLVKKP